MAMNSERTRGGLAVVDGASTCPPVAITMAPLARMRGRLFCAALAAAPRWAWVELLVPTGQHGAHVAACASRDGDDAVDHVNILVGIEAQKSAYCRRTVQGPYPEGDPPYLPSPEPEPEAQPLPELPDFSQYFPPLPAFVPPDCSKADCLDAWLVFTSGCSLGCAAVCIPSTIAYPECVSTCVTACAVAGATGTLSCYFCDRD